MIRLLHTADLQLGMPFHWAPGDAGARLRQERFHAVDRLLALAVERAVDAILVAGDLFDDNTLEDRVVHQALHRLEQAAVPVIVLPGNHDHCGEPNAIFRRTVVAESGATRLHVITDREPISLLGGRLLILPAPIFHRVEQRDPTQHLTADLGRDIAPEAVRVGLAHGSIRDFGRADPGAIHLDVVERARLDYLALGDWHGTLEVTPRAWYSGTPEPTGFKANSPGFALEVAIPAPGAEPEVTRHRTARTTWLQHEVTLYSADDVDGLRAWYAQLEAPLDTVVRLVLAGTLPWTEVERLERLLGRVAGEVLHLDRRGEVTTQPNDSELAALASDGYLKVAIDRLVKQAASGGADADVARRALHILFLAQREAGR